jgi:hypothetical protein
MIIIGKISPRKKKIINESYKTVAYKMCLYHYTIYLVILACVKFQNFGFPLNNM